ncbi:MAG TPA: carboxyl transferase [Deltaproteobacteria bacterium]|nr:carboxyl transferase [Deltaproteobacteria bacterium]
MKFEDLLVELASKRTRALDLGGPDKVQKHHEKGRLTARERIGRLLDADSFLEFGMLACSDRPGMEEKTPADGIITGFGLINGRQVGIVANDFTVLASSNSRVYSKKAKFIREQAVEKGLPLVWLGESGGGRLPDLQGVRGIVTLAGEGGSDRWVFSQYSRSRETPWIIGIMGTSNGVPMWQACLSDFVVQIKGSTLSVSGARALKKSIAATYSDEDMGGWRIHAEHTGISDRTAEDEEDCFGIIKKFLGYMPSNNREVPPRTPVPEGSGASMAEILEILPQKRTRAYDMYKLIQTLVDIDSVFDLKPTYGKTIITCLARIDGHVVGIVANQPMVAGGAMDTDALDKMVSFLCLCDSFNIPLVFLHDTPGFLVGKDAELNKVGVKVTNALHALAQVTVPKISIIIRKSYGQAGANMCGPGVGPDVIVSWPTGEGGFLDPETAADIVFGELSDEERHNLTQEMLKDTSMYPLAQEFFIHDVIDPRQTREFLCTTLRFLHNSKTGGIGRHLLANWPTKF